MNYNVVWLLVIDHQYYLMTYLNVNFVEFIKHENNNISNTQKDTEENCKQVLHLLYFIMIVNYILIAWIGISFILVQK